MNLFARRRSRLLAGLLILASPAGAGAVLPLVHPCPVDSPWLAGHATQSSHAGHGAPAAPDSGSPHHQSCHCIGCSTLAALPGVPAAAPAAAARNPDPAPAWFPRDASLRLAPLATLLPPATAPPVG